MRILGIDMGSREVKLAVMEDGIITCKTKYPTVHFYRNCCTFDGTLRVNLHALGLEDTAFHRCISTGYGRNNTNLQQFDPISEIKAHVWGAIHQSGMRDFALLDVGGQDVKVAKVQKGLVHDLDLNEKCAASCGRFLENMAALLELKLDDLCRHYDDPVPINSTCAVFSESELIGRVASGIPTEQLCAGVNRALYLRLLPLLELHRGLPLLVSGGVARNRALIHYLRQDFESVNVLEDPQYNGAIGCCHYGRRLHEKENPTDVSNQC